MPLQTRLSGEMTFGQLLKQTRETALDAFANQDLPFEKIVEELQPERSLDHLPFTRLMLVLQNEVREQIQLPGVTMKFLEVEPETAKFDLTFLAQETSTGLVAKVEYNTDLFEAGTIERLLGH